MQEQLDRIEGKLDDYAKQTATNTADIAWLKRGVSAFGSLVTLVFGYFFRKHT